MLGWGKAKSKEVLVTAPAATHLYFLRHLTARSLTQPWRFQRRAKLI